MKRLKGLLGLLSPYIDLLSSPYQQRDERRPAPEFVACHNTGLIPQEENIKDISSTGIYLLTEERWLPGTIVAITLQKRGTDEADTEHRVTLRARTVRWGHDGVGLAFTLPKDLNFNLWRSVLESAADHTRRDIVSPFRMAAALAFLGRMCPAKAAELRQLLRSGLGNLRVANAVEIALNAERMLASYPNADRMHADPQIVLRIIEDGSWADEDWIKQFWEGLLAATCCVDDSYESTEALVECFSQMAPIHVIIFRSACAKAVKILSEAGTLAAQPLIFTPAEIQRITGSQNLAKIERDIHHLCELGLIEESVRSRSLMPPEKIPVTPTALGLKLYARCFGYRGNPQSFYGLDFGYPTQKSLLSQEP